MKKKLLILTLSIAMLIVVAQPAEAKIWRVNNNVTGTYGQNFGGTAANPVFKQVNDANASNLVSATNGDTLYVEGSTLDYTSATITKKLVIIGPGYFLNENPRTSNDILEVRLADITFNATSEGSKLMGIYVNGFYGISINASNILIRRCKIDKSVTVNYNITDISILQNYFSNADHNNTSAIVANFYGFPTNFVFNNNICKKTLLLVSNGVTDNAMQCNNNVFDCPAVSGGPSIRMIAGTFQNNILTLAAATVDLNLANTNVSYNISSSETGQFGTNNHNIVVPDITSVFITNSTADGNYQIANGSAADNKGSDGTDPGAFGGTAVTSRYTLSGLAPIPVIYEITSAGVANASGLPVTVKARVIK